MENYNIKDLLKANNVKRWHTVDTVRSQSLAEHQYNVAILATQIAIIMNLDNSEIHLVTLKALTHDIEEVWTGDLPSPYKEKLKLTGGSPSHVDTGGALMPRLDPGVRPVATRDDGDICSAIIRAADLIDAVWWSNKYVMDDAVVQDCAKRLQKFQIDRMGDNLNKAIAQIMTELLH